MNLRLKFIGCFLVLGTLIALNAWGVRAAPHEATRWAWWSGGLALAVVAGVGFGLFRAQARALQELNRELAAQREELAKTEGRFRRMFHASPVATALSDLASGEFLDVNDTFCELCGRPREELIGCTSVVIGLWQDGAVTQERLRVELAKTGKLFEVETSLCRPDGSIRRVALAAEVIDLAGRQAIHMGFFDVADRNDAQRVVREREQLLTSINANLPGSSIYRSVYHPDGRMECTYISPNVESLIGVSAAEFQADAASVFRLIHPEDLPVFKRQIADALATGGRASFVVRLRHGRGGAIWAQFRSQLVERRPDGAQVRDGVVVDVSAVKQAEAELQSVRRRLELALSASRTCTWESAAAGARMTLDAGWAEMRGFPPEETVTTWRRLLATAHPGDRAAISDGARRAITGETDDYQLEHRVATAQGGWMWIRSHGRVVERDARGVARRIMGTNTDITARKEAEDGVRELNANLERLVAERTAALAMSNDRLGKSERLYRNLVENINQGYFVADRRSQVTYCNPAAAAVLGLTEAEFVGKSVFRLVADEDRARVVAAYRDAVRAGAPEVVIEFRLPIQSGRVLWVEHRTTIVRDAAEAVVEFHSSVRDITERRAAEQLLRQSNERFYAVFERSPIMIGLLSVPDGKLVEFNAAGVEIFGYTRAEAIGRTSVELQLWADEADRDRYLRELRAKGHVTGFEARMRRKNGETFTVIYSGSLIEIAGKTYSLNSLQDISAWRGAEAALRLSEERLTFALEATRDGLWDWTIATGEVHFSPQWERLLGFEPGEVPGRVEFFFTIVHPDDGAQVRHALDEHLAGRLPVKQSEVRLRMKSGEYRWFLDRGKVVGWDAAGRPARMVGTITDITARKHGEETVARSVASLQATLESTADGILTVGADQRIESYNRPFVAMWRIPSDVLASRDDRPLLSFVLDQLSEPDRFLDKVRHLYAHPLEESFDLLSFRDGRVFERVSRPMLVGGSPTGRVWSFRDITDSNRAKLRLAAFAKLGRELNATNRVEEAATIITGVADELFGWDSATLDLYDAERDRVRPIINVDVVEGRRASVLPVHVDRPPTPRMRRAINDGAELILRTPPLATEWGGVPFGDVARLSASLMIVPLREGTRVVGLLSIQSYRFQAYTTADLEALQTMADHCAAALVRIQTINALRASEERFRSVWENSTDGMKLSDAEGRIVAVNAAYCRILRKRPEDVVGRCLSTPYAEPERAAILARYLAHFRRREVPVQREWSVTLWDGREVLLESDDRFIETDQARPLVLCVFRDITERRRAENEREKMQTRLFQNQKFEALGTLAGGVAHDFNNILAGMLNYTAIAREDCPPSHPEIREYLGEVLNGGNRAKDLVRQILLLSRSQNAERVPVQVALVVREALALLRSTIPAAVEIAADIDRRAPLVLANATQMHQVFMNLGINAAHAMRERGGTLSVKLQQRFVDHAMAAELVDLKPGTHVWVEVKDTGCGMDPAVVARMFEPFFTTKKTGEGTGLGLAVVRSVVRSHLGAITVRSQPGTGSTFELYFPAADVTEGEARSERREPPRGRGQRILLVDDEAMITRSMQLVMERLGYAVTTFNQPERALARFESAPDDFDLVITDFQMPGMTGVDLALKLMACRPEIGIFISSGFSGNLTDEETRELGLRGLLRKPIDVTELADVLGRAFAPAP